MQDGFIIVEVIIFISIVLIFKKDKWHEYDDDDVTAVSWNDIMGLSGGSDNHSAYIMIYRKLEEYKPKVVEMEEEKTVEIKEEKTE